MEEVGEEGQEEVKEGKDEKMSLLAAIRQQIITHAINDQNILAKANNIPRYYPARKVNKVRISIPVLKDNPVTGIPVPGIVIFCVRTIWIKKTDCRV